MLRHLRRAFHTGTPSYATVELTWALVLAAARQLPRQVAAPIPEMALTVRPATVTLLRYYRKGRIMAEELREWAVLALSALAHDSRLQVHRLLVQAGEDGLSAGAIAEHLNMPASSLSFHLAHMQAAEMVRQRRDGRSLIYTANFECMDALMKYLQDNCCQGVPPRPSSRTATQATPRQQVRASTR